MRERIEEIVQQGLVRIAAERSRLDARVRALEALHLLAADGDSLEALAEVFAGERASSRRLEVSRGEESSEEAAAGQPGGQEALAFGAHEGDAGHAQPAGSVVPTPGCAGESAEVRPVENGGAPAPPRDRGGAATAGKPRSRDGQERVKGLLADGRARRVAEIAEALAITEKSAAGLVQRLRTAGATEAIQRGLWTLAGQGAPPSAPDCGPPAGSVVPTPGRASPASSLARPDELRHQAARLLHVNGPQPVERLAADLGVPSVAAARVLDHPWFEQQGESGASAWTLSSAGWAHVRGTKEDA